MITKQTENYITLGCLNEYVDSPKLLFNTSARNFFIKRNEDKRYKVPFKNQLRDEEFIQYINDPEIKQVSVDVTPLYDEQLLKIINRHSYEKYTREKTSRYGSNLPSTFSLWERIMSNHREYGIVCGVTVSDELERKIRNTNSSIHLTKILHSSLRDHIEGHSHICSPTTISTTSPIRNFVNELNRYKLMGLYASTLYSIFNHRGFDPNKTRSIIKTINDLDEGFGAMTFDDIYKIKDVGQ